jgi:hypothetical protein
VPVVEIPLANRRSSDMAETETTTGKLSFSVATRNAFFNRVSSQLAKRVPEQHREFTARPMFNLMKVAYANERVHYEVAIDLNHQVLEIALHFEDGPISTLAYLTYLDRRIVELKHDLGHEIELERWTASWGRVYELWPLEKIDQPVADRVAARLADYVVTLQPLIESSGIAPERSVQPATAMRDRWRRTSRS